MVSLAAENLGVSLGGKNVLQNISCAFAAGTLTGIIGPNGAGKSTLLKSLAHIIAPSQGRVVLEGHALSAMDAKARARAIAYLPQGQVLHWPLGVARLVALGRLPHLAPLSRMGGADHEAVHRAMKMADVAHLEGRVATTLSGGELSRVLLARALCVEAPVLIVDEPLAALDPAHQLAVMTLLGSLAASGHLVIAVLHDLTMASRFCDRLLLLSEGQVAAEGRPGDVLSDEIVRRIYHVEALTGSHGGQRYVMPWEEARKAPPS